MKKKLNITIDIADVERFRMEIDREDEELVRTAAYQVNKVWQMWSHEYADRSSKDILAMVALQFARLFYKQKNINSEQQQLIAGFEDELDRLLQIMGTLDADRQPDADAEAASSEA